MDDSNEMKENNESNEKEEEVEAGSRMACNLGCHVMAEE